jgi:SSS family transporter
MDWLREHVIALAFIALYLGMVAWHAWLGQQRSRSMADFLVGGRGLGGVVIALSFYATFVSSVTFVGHAGRSYEYGPTWWLTCVVVFTSMVLVAWFVVAGPFIHQARGYGALTIPDFLGHRYQSRSLRRLAGVVAVAASLAYMVAVYDGAARSLEGLLHLNSYVIMAVIFVVVTAYTLTGGFHSVVATDGVQGLILFAGGMLLPAAMIWHEGGVAPLLQSVQDADPTALAWSGKLSLFTMVGLALGVGLKFIVEPRQLSRFYGLSSHEQLKRGRWLAPALLFLTYLGMLPVGFLAHGFIPKGTITKTDEVVPYLLGTTDLLGPVGGAFFLTALAAAAMSSLDSVLLVAASSIDHDVIAPDREEIAAMWHTRVWVLLLSALAAGLALVRAQGIVEMSAFSGSLYAAAFLPALVVGLFWRRATRTGALASLLVGFVVTVFWFYGKHAPWAERFKWLHEIYLGVAVSLCTYVVVSLLTPSPRLQS